MNKLHEDELTKAGAAMLNGLMLCASLTSPGYAHADFLAWFTPPKTERLSENKADANARHMREQQDGKQLAEKFEVILRRLHQSHAACCLSRKTGLWQWTGPTNRRAMLNMASELFVQLGLTSRPIPKPLLSGIAAKPGIARRSPANKPVHTKASPDANRPPKAGLARG